MKHLVINLLLILGVLPATGQELAANTLQLTLQPTNDLSDTVTVRRGALVTSVYQHGEKLSRRELWGLYHAYPEASRAMKWSTPLRIAGPVAAAGGVALGAIALRGKAKTATFDDKVYHYKTRSKPQLLGGLALVAGGMCLFEFSNDLIARSARSYNKARITRGKQAVIRPENIHLGITPEGNVGLVWRW